MKTKKVKKPKYKETLAAHSALWGDQYALTMAQAFFTNGKHNINTTFHAFIRKNPFNGGFLVTGGQNIFFEWLKKHWKFDKDDILLMKSKMVEDPVSGQMKPLYTPEFIDMVKNAKLELTVDAMPEGEIAFPDEPIYRIHGPLWQCLMVEAALLNIMNSQSLFATLAARLVDVAEGGPVLEFGLRRAQSLGALESSRAAYVGGVTATSNMLAEKYYGIPAAGTFAHALVMVAEDELEAFKDYAKAMPYNGIFLVDTYNTLEGVRKAVQACRETGIVLKGIRLDSGDLAYLSKEARKILDESGFTKAKIVASNDLDEEIVASLKLQGAKIDVWGIGTNLVTAKAQPALGGVYKLGAVYNADLSQAEIEATRTLVREGRQPHVDPAFMRDVIKLSEQTIKVSIPGELDILRYIFYSASGSARFDGDTIIHSLSRDPLKKGTDKSRQWPDILAYDIISVRKDNDTLVKRFTAQTPVYRPLKRIFTEGKMVMKMETVHDARARAAEGMKMLDPSHRRLKNPHKYVVGIEKNLYEKRRQMIADLRQV